MFLIFNKTIILHALLGYEMIIANSYPTRTRGIIVNCTENELDSDGNPNLQVSLRMRRKYVASISFGLPLRMNGMHRTQFDHVCFLSLFLSLSHLRTVMEQKRFDL